MKKIAVPLQGDVQTNQKAELTAVVLVLQAESRLVEIRSDSKYVVGGAETHLPAWRRHGWLDIDNGDLWVE